MNRRLNITLPEQTVRMLDRAVPRGQRSRLIDEAVRRFVREQGRANLRKQLALGAVRASGVLLNDGERNLGCAHRLARNCRGDRQPYHC